MINCADAVLDRYPFADVPLPGEPIEKESSTVKDIINRIPHLQVKFKRMK